MLIAVRHAPPLVTGVCAGWADIAVEAVEPSARRAHEAVLAVAEPVQIVASPTARTSELARELSRLFGVPLRFDERLRELHFGSWEGRAWSELDQSDAVQAWMKKWRTARPPGGETVGELEERVRRCLAEMPSEPTLIVTHAGVIRAALVIGGQLSWEEAMGRAVPYLTAVVLGTRDRWRKCSQSCAGRRFG